MDSATLRGSIIQAEWTRSVFAAFSYLLLPHPPSLGGSGENRHGAVVQDQGSSSYFKGGIKSQGMSLCISKRRRYTHREEGRIRGQRVTFTVSISPFKIASLGPLIWRKDFRNIPIFISKTSCPQQGGQKRL